MNKKITFYEKDGTAHSVVLCTRLLPEVVRNMQRVLYVDNGQPQGTFQIHSDKRILLSIPGANLRAGYIIQDAR